MATEAPDREAEEQAIRSIRSVPPVEGTPDEEPIASAESFRFTKATLLSAPGQAGSASGGAKGTLKFEVATEELGALMATGQLGTTSFFVKWGKFEFGDLAVGSWAGRPDENSSAKSFLTFLVSDQVLPLLAQAYARRLFGKTEPLLLDPGQVSMEELLAKKA